MRRTAAAGKINGPAARNGPGSPRGTPRVGGGPTMDGRIITVRSFFDVAPEISKNIPMLIGSVSEEGNRMALAPHRGRVACHPREQLRRGESHGADRGDEEGASGKEHSHAFLWRQRPAGRRNNVTRMAKLKHDQKARRPTRISLPGNRRCWRRRRLAHCRAGLLLRQHQRCEQGTGNTPEARRWRRRWRRPGPILRARAIPASPA